MQEFSAEALFEPTDRVHLCLEYVGMGFYPLAMGDALDLGREQQVRNCCTQALDQLDQILAEVKPKGGRLSEGDMDTSGETPSTFSSHTADGFGLLDESIQVEGKRRTSKASRRDSTVMSGKKKPLASQGSQNIDLSRPLAKTFAEEKKEDGGQGMMEVDEGAGKAPTKASCHSLIAVSDLWFVQEPDVAKDEKDDKHQPAQQQQEPLNFHTQHSTPKPTPTAPSKKKQAKSERQPGEPSAVKKTPARAIGASHTADQGKKLDFSSVAEDPAEFSDPVLDLDMSNHNDDAKVLLQSNSFAFVHENGCIEGCDSSRHSGASQRKEDQAFRSRQERQRPPTKDC